MASPYSRTIGILPTYTLLFKVKFVRRWVVEGIFIYHVSNTAYLTTPLTYANLQPWTSNTLILLVPEVEGSGKSIWEGEPTTIYLACKEQKFSDCQTNNLLICNACWCLVQDYRLQYASDVQLFVSNTVSTLLVPCYYQLGSQSQVFIFRNLHKNYWI